MGFMTAVITCIRKYVNFNGRACRSEYWYFSLFILLVGTALLTTTVLTMGTAASPRNPNSLFWVVFGLFDLATILPLLAVSVRRLHDMNHSGWWMLISLVAYVGSIILLIWFCMRGTKGDNRFGPNPLATAASPTTA